MLFIWVWSKVSTDTWPVCNYIYKVVDYAIVVAGGKGRRMGGGVPKQFLLLYGKPVLMHTLLRFHEALPDCRLIVVLPRDNMDEWKSLCGEYNFTLPHSVTAGGVTRFDSVHNGLSLVPDGEQGVVGIHDGVRPFVGMEVIRHCYEQALISGAVVPALQSVESVRFQSGDDTTKALDRRRCFLVQTPQSFRIDIIKRAYAQPYRETFTDDASVAESAGFPVRVVDGNRENIKLTTPFDFLLAKVILEDREN